MNVSLLLTFRVALVSYLYSFQILAFTCPKFFSLVSGVSQTNTSTQTSLVSAFVRAQQTENAWRRSHTGRSNNQNTTTEQFRQEAVAARLEFARVMAIERGLNPDMVTANWAEALWEAHTNFNPTNGPISTQQLLAKVRILQRAGIPEAYREAFLRGQGSEGQRFSVCGNERESFLTAIRMDPNDDTIRLVFADWLEERGTDADHAYSTFIRAQVERAQLENALDLWARHEGEWTPRIRELLNIERDLLSRYQAAWVAHIPELPPGATNPVFHRGFISEITLPPFDWNRGFFSGSISRFLNANPMVEFVHEGNSNSHRRYLGHSRLPESNGQTMSYSLAHRSNTIARFRAEVPYALANNPVPAPGASPLRIPIGDYGEIVVERRPRRGEVIIDAQLWAPGRVGMSDLCFGVYDNQGNLLEIIRTIASGHGFGSSSNLPRDIHLRFIGG